MNRSRQILESIARKHNLQVSDILGRDRFDHFVEARREAIVEMFKARMEPSYIAKVFSRDHTTIYHHLSERIRDRKRAYHSRRWKERQARASI